MKKSFLVHAVEKMGAAAAGRTGQDLSVHVNKVFHPNTLACRRHGLCGKQRAKKLRVTCSNERLTASVKTPARRCQPEGRGECLDPFPTAVLGLALGLNPELGGCGVMGSAWSSCSSKETHPRPGCTGTFCK